MPASPVYNGSTIPYGSRSITLSGAGAAVADSIEITRPTTILERTNEYGEPTGWIAVPGFVTGTASLQMATDAVAPNVGETFSATFVTSVGSETFVVTEVGIPEEKGSLKMISVSFRKTATGV